jgi:tRNA(fMet)-specific endonuclease VapC
MTYLLDTNICIYIIKNQYVDLVKKLRVVGIENVGISTITLAELEFGVANSNRPSETMTRLYEFLVPFTIIDFNMDSARYYGKIRKELKDLGQPIGPMDLLIAAIALAHNQTLVTNNVKKFEKVTELKIENWITSY